MACEALSHTFDHALSELGLVADKVDVWRGMDNEGVAGGEGVGGEGVGSGGHNMAPLHHACHDV